MPAPLQLKSFLSGAWVSGDGPQSVLYDAVTGEPMAETSTRGIDLGAAMAYARDVGGPALRAMTFAQRGALLERLSVAIHTHRDELIELAIKLVENIWQRKYPDRYAPLGPLV